MAPLVIVISVLFGGFYINTDNIPIWIRWLDSCSHVRWAYTAFAINEFTGAEFSGCESGESGCYSNGEQILELLSMNNFSLWDPIRNLLCLFAFYHCLAYLLLRFKKTRYMQVSDPTRMDTTNDNDGARDATVELMEETKKEVKSVQTIDISPNSNEAGN